MSGFLIELERVSKVYRRTANPVHALREVSLAVRAGEMVAVMGPSGSGKSTLMHILGCLDRPDDGRYLLAGKDVTGLSKEELARVRNRFIGFVFQNFNLLGRATALENVALPLIYAGLPPRERERRAREMLRLMGLEEFVDHLPSQLSGGQQQRVAIARALVNEPELLLADEPTGALDTQTSAEILAVLQDLHRQRRLTVVVVTHEPEVAYHCQRIIRLRDGRVVGEETVEEPRRACREAASQATAEGW